MTELEDLPNLPDGARLLEKARKTFAERRAGVGPKPTSTGIRKLDNALNGGLRGGKTYIIAARPGMGKTSLVQCIRRSLVTNGHCVAEFNLEMPEEEIMERELAFHSNVSSALISNPTAATADDAVKVAKTVGAIPEGHWWLWDDVYAITEIVDLSKVAKKMAERKGKKLKAIVIDYLGLVEGGTDDRSASVAGFSRALKKLSKELDVSILILVQLNRACETRRNKRPQMNDLRDSGAIEQDADVILFPYRHSQYDPDHPEEDAELNVAKQRGYRKGNIRLHWDGKFQTFSDPPKPPPMPPLDFN